MKNVLLVILIVLINFSVFCQEPIPYGKTFDTVVTSFEYGPKRSWPVEYYKPDSYTPNGGVLIYFHGIGGDENEGYGIFKGVAKRQGCILMGIGSETWSYASYLVYVNTDEGYGFKNQFLHEAMKQFYREILRRESIDSMPVRIVGFSAGGQCVTRYMLLRQAIPDSIPLQAAVSINPYYYTFPTEYYKGVKFDWTCGVGRDLADIYSIDIPFGCKCDEHINRYYSENYTVMIGTADTIPVPGGGCIDVQGSTRYERAQNFFEFCQQDAQERGVDFNWNYQEVAGIGHDGYAMSWATFPNSTMLMSEYYLFYTTKQPEKFYPPTADFDFIKNPFSSCGELYIENRCTWQLLPTEFHWEINGFDFYTDSIRFYFNKNTELDVKLFAKNELGEDSIQKIIVIDDFPEIEIEVSDTITYLPNAVISFFETTNSVDSLLWYVGEGEVSTSTNYTHTYKKEGAYDVVLVGWNEKGCGSSVDAIIEVLDTTSVTDTTGNVHIEIVPEPNNACRVTSNYAITSIQIFTSIGTLLDTYYPKNNTFLIENNTYSGILILVANTSNGSLAKKIYIN